VNVFFSVFGLIRKLDSVMGHTVDQLYCLVCFTLFFLEVARFVLTK
jgi:hypothetical protein